MRRPIPPFAVAVLALTVASCGRSGGDDISLPVATPLSPDGVRHQEHSFSPDGTRIAYWSPAADSDRMQLWVANADLSAPVKLPVTALPTLTL